MVILETNNLTKTYKQKQVLNGLSFKLEQGQVLGILGPNGSGKSTALGILLGVIKPTTGSYRWYDHKHASNDLAVGALLEKPCFYPYLNARKNLQLIATIRGITNSHTAISKTLDLVGLEDDSKVVFSEFSSGMQQRLGFAAAFLGDQEVMILDEPNNHLDAKGIVEIRDLIKKLASQGKTFIIASHILAEVEKFCSHVIIIKNGTTLDQGALPDLLKYRPLEEYYLNLTGGL